MGQGWRRGWCLEPKGTEVATPGCGVGGEKNKDHSSLLCLLKPCELGQILVGQEAINKSALDN